MGCNNGKMVQVMPMEAPTDGKNIKTGAIMVKSNTSSSSLREGELRPSGSATSKVSKHSQDSGYDGNDLEEGDGIDEYANMITENSEGALVDELEKNFQPPELDLCLSGMPAPRNLSAKDKARLDEQRILEDLRNEGLIATSKFQAKSGLAFEVVEATTMPRRALPARLATIDKKKKKKKTKEEIAEKLARAEKRRKEAESEKLEKINAVTLKSDVNVSNVQEEQQNKQQEILENTIKRVDTVAEKREQMLQEKKDKQKAREERAAKVRLRKKLNIPTQEEIDQLNEQSLQIAKQEGIQMGEAKVIPEIPVNNTQPSDVTSSGEPTAQTTQETATVAEE